MGARVTAEQRLARLERRFYRMAILLAVIAVTLSCAAAFEGYEIYGFETMKSLRLEKLSIYDSKGVDRVVIAGDLPQAEFHGKTIGAGRHMGGILIYDQSGTERGGYGTVDGYANALLTLDGEKRQVILMLAEPAGTPFFRLWHDKGSVTTGVGDAGTPFLTVKKGKDVIFARPKENPWTSRGLR